MKKKFFNLNFLDTVITHIKKKTIIISIIILVSFFFFLGFYRDYKLNTQNNSQANHLVEIDNSEITGYKNNKINWKITAKQIWAGHNRDILTAENILNGQVFDDYGKVIIKNFQAESIIMNRYSKSLSGEKINCLLSNRKSIKNNNVLEAYEDKNQTLNIKSNAMRYFGDSKKTYFYNGVILTQGKSKIFTETIEVDNEKNIAYLDRPFRMQGTDFTVSGNQMIIYIDDEYSELMGNISGFRPGTVIKNMAIDERERLLKAKNTYLKCDYLKYITKNDADFVELKGNIVISQNDKSIAGDIGSYDNKNNLFILNSNIKLNAENLYWLIKKQKRNALKNGEIKKSLGLATTLNADKIIFDAKKKIANVIGNILITQKDKEINADQMNYDDSKNLVTLLGNVKIVREKTDKLTCQLVEINLDKEEFYVEQNVESQFVIKKKKNKKQ